jgi:hypothetical protein
MFDFLHQASAEQATASVYYATRLIRHAKYVKREDDKLRVKELQSEPSALDVSLANRIIAEIEAHEKSSLAKLDQSKSEEYIQILSDTLQTQLRNTLKYDEGRGKQLLGELRKDKIYAFTAGLYEGARHLTDFSKWSGRWVSYFALAISLLTFLYGVELARTIDVRLLTPQQTNKTIIEGFIAVFNVILALWVLFGLWFRRPIKISQDNSPASESFTQLLRGWRLLWFTWLLFYGCLAAIWLRYVNVEELNIWLQYVRIDEPKTVWRLLDGLNALNGFFFYYLFFVLDQPSVPTKTEPNRARSFRRNCLITFLLGFILFAMPWILHLLNEFIRLENLDNGVLLSKLVPAYIAVGMAFFFGRLDSHYLRLPRVILAPLYLYAVVQLFWSPKVLDVNEFDGERVAVFSIALVLKYVVFLNLTKLIRHKNFHRYFVVAERGLRES